MTLILEKTYAYLNPLWFIFIISWETSRRPRKPDAFPDQISVNFYGESTDIIFLESFLYLLSVQISVIEVDWEIPCKIKKHTKFSMNISSH